MDRKELLLLTGIAKGKYMLENQTKVLYIKAKEINKNYILFNIISTHKTEDYIYNIKQVLK